METAVRLSIHGQCDSPSKRMSVEGGPRVWEVPWSTDDMRNRSHSWSLAGDAGLLNKLQEMAQVLVSQTHRIQQEMNALVQETDSCNARLSNTFNDFLMLSNTQFVENRVYDDEVTDVMADEKKQANKSKEERESEIVSRVSEALRLGLVVIDAAYEQLQVQDSDSEEEDGMGASTGHEPILHPKDRYANRPLPYIIGTSQFMEDDYVGLGAAFTEGEISESVDVDDDDESSLSSAVEEEWNPVRPTLEKVALTSTKDYDKDSFSEDINEPSSAYEPKEHVDDSEESHTSDLFSGQDAHDNDSVGASTEKTQQTRLKRSFTKELSAKLMAPDTRVNRGNSISSISSSGSSDDDSSLFKPRKLVKETAKKKIVRESSPIKTPSKVGSRSSFDSGEQSAAKSRRSPTPEFGAEQGSDREDDDDDGGLFGGGGLFAKSSRLFDENEQDLFSSISTRIDRATAAADKKKAVVEGSPVPPDRRSRQSKQSSFATDDLFGSSGQALDDEDDDDDLFSSIASSTKKAPMKSFIFKDDGNDLLSADKKGETDDDPFLKISSKKKPAGAVSMFGGAVNPLSLGLPQHTKNSRENSIDSTDGGGGRSSAVSSSRSASLSEATRKPSLSDATRKPSMSEANRTPSLSEATRKPSPSLSEATRKPSPSNSAASGSLSLFADERDDDDLFGLPTTTPANVRGADSVFNQPKRSLFGVSGDLVEDEDDDNDIFAPKRKTTSVTPSVQQPVSVSNKQSTVAIDASLVARETSPRSAPAKISLFDEDGDDGETVDGSFDLFGGSATSASRAGTTSAARTTAGSGGDVGSERSGGGVKSLFGGDGSLFDADPDVDLFGGGSGGYGGSGKSSAVAAKPVAAPSTTVKSMKDEAKSGGVTVAVSTKTSSPGLFADNDDEDLFGPSPASVGEKSVQKVRQSPLPIARRIIPPEPKKEAASEDNKLVEPDRRRLPVATPVLSDATVTSPRRRPPVGGVSMFGGILPPLLNKRAPDSDEEEQVAEVSNKSLVSPAEKRTADELTQSLGTSHAHTVGSSETLSATFDEPVEANVLTNANKDRIKIPVKRRPPSRRGRQEALRKSAIEVLVDDGDEDVHLVATGSASAPTSPTTLPTTPFRSAAPPPLKPESIASPSTDEECDLFPISDAHTRAAATPPSHQPPRASTKVAPPSEGGRSDPFGGSSDDGDGDDLFRPRPRAAPPKVSPRVSPRPTHKQIAGVGDQSTPEPSKNEGKSGNKLSILEDSLGSEKEDLFAVVGPSAAKTSQAKVAAKKKVAVTKGKSLFGDDDDDDDDDLFGSVGTSKFATKSTPTAQSSEPRTSSSDKAATKRTSAVTSGDKSAVGSSFDDPLGLLGGK